MEHIIVADKDGNELRDLTFSSYDIEVGIIENSFQVEILRNEYESIPKDARIYIPGTEYGGLFRRLETDTSRDVISPGGLTWRGMMQKKIIEPLIGDDYATDSGELNAIIRRRVEAAFPGMFMGANESTGVSVSNFQYDRYCTLEEGLRKLLKSKNYKMDISYSQTERSVVVSAVPIVDYSQSIEMSSDMQLDYLMQMISDGVNHLVCLGDGELKDRTVYHLYIDSRGRIGTTQYYTGVDEIAEVYDYAGAELSDLIQYGTERLKEVANQNTFQITVDSDIDIAIGDIVGGRDYLSGMTMKSPIASKIVRWSNGFRSIEYLLEEDIESSVEQPSVQLAMAKASMEEVKRNKEDKLE